MYTHIRIHILYTHWYSNVLIYSDFSLLHTHTLSLSILFSFSLFVSLSVSLRHTDKHTYTHALTYTHTHTHTNTHTQKHSHTHILSHTHTHTHSLTLTPAHTYLHIQHTLTRVHAACKLLLILASVIRINSKIMRSKQFHCRKSCHKTFQCSEK